MKIILFTVFYFLVLSSIAQNSVQDALRSFVNQPAFVNSSISFFAIDVKTGDTIAQHNASLSLPPASTTKLFSTATALEIIGANYKPFTRIYSDGLISTDSIINGNLWIRGGGDPTLGSKYYNPEGDEKHFLYAWADSLKKLGIKKINGNIIADGSEFGYNGIPDGWSWSDIGNYYGAGPSGLVIYDNMLRFYFKTGNTIGSKAHLISMFPKVDNLVFSNYIEASRVNGDNSYIYGGPYSLDRFATGALPLNSNSFLVKGSLPDPEFQFAKEIYLVLKESGIEITGTYDAVRKMNLNSVESRYGSDFHLLYSHVGPSIQSIATYTNMHSVNLFAEELLCLSGYKTNENGSMENSLHLMEHFWKNKFDCTGLYLKDGSGLSRSNAISAKHFCSLLVTMSKSKNYDAFYSTLPIAGVSGTLSNVCNKQAGEGRIHAKSGTINRIKSYAGYVESTSGKTIAFAFIINNYNSSTSYVVNQMEKVFNAMAVF